MEIQQKKLVSESKTIGSIRASNKISYTFMGLGVAIALFMGYAPEKLKTQAAQTAGLILTGLSFGQRLYNKAAEDGRINIGDLISAGEEDIVGARVILHSSGETNRLKAVQSFIETGDTSSLNEVKPAPPRKSANPDIPPSDR